MTEPVEKPVPHIVKVDGVYVAMVPDNYSAQSMRRFVEEAREYPKRRRGCAQLETVGSLVDWALRFKTDESALFASINGSDPQIVCVSNYHPPTGSSEPDAADWCDHRGAYHFPCSEEWKRWASNNGYSFGQAEFARFLEERAIDVVDPSTATDGVGDFAKTLGVKLAGPGKLMSLSRGLSVTVSGKVAGSVNLSSGEGQISYVEEHKDDRGEKVKVPGGFIIAIPIFEGGDLYTIGVRLMYRVRKGEVMWSYSLRDAKRRFRHAAEGACTKVAGATGIPLFFGSPES